VDLKLSPQIKIVAAAGVVAALAAFAGLHMLGASSSADASAVPIKTYPRFNKQPAPVVKKAKAPVKHQVAATPAERRAVSAAKAKAAKADAKAAKAKARAKARAAAGAAAAAAAAAAPALVSGLPAVLASLLERNPVVIVSIYNSQSQTDAIAFAEAQAGADLAGAGFLAVNVLDERIAAPLTAALGSGLLPDPGVLVYRRPGTLATRVDGFLDRDAVAQAASNAELLVTQ
jgi:hypothetical protein